MKRILPAALLLLAFYAVADHPVSAQDQLYYISPETRKEVKDPLIGKIKAESPGGVTITVGKEDKVIPALDVVQIAFKTVKSGLSDYRSPYGNIENALKTNVKTDGKKRRDFFTKALKDLTEVSSRDLKDNSFAERYIQYRIAEIQYRIAMDDGQRTQAIKAMEDYTSLYKDGWEIVPALKTLARLHEDGNDVTKALATLERLADLPGVPKEIKREGNVAVSQMLMRAKRYPEAEKRLMVLLDSLPPGDAARAATQVYLVQTQVAQKKTEGAEKNLKDAIAGTNDALLRGMAYNGLGDYYREKGQTEEAFWQYLRVDTLYNLDAHEHAKAIYHLSELFKVKKFGDRTGDPIRAKTYRERLQDKRFEETEYPKLVPKEP